MNREIRVCGSCFMRSEYVPMNGKTLQCTQLETRARVRAHLLPATCDLVFDLLILRSSTRSSIRSFDLYQLHGMCWVGYPTARCVVRVLRWKDRQVRILRWNLMAMCVLPGWMFHVLRLLVVSVSRFSHTNDYDRVCSSGGKYTLWD